MYFKKKKRKSEFLDLEAEIGTESESGGLDESEIPNSQDLAFIVPDDQASNETGSQKVNMRAIYADALMVEDHPMFSSPGTRVRGDPNVWQRILALAQRDDLNVTIDFDEEEEEEESVQASEAEEDNLVLDLSSTPSM